MSQQTPKFNPVNFYLRFSGRINRKQFWLYGVLPILIAQVVAAILTAVILAAGSGSLQSLLIVVGILFLVLFVLYIAIVWVGLAVQIKRWHDRDKAAWWIFIGAIPIAGPIWAFVELGFLPGTPSENRYGPVP